MTESCLHEPKFRNWLLARVYDPTETLEVQLAAAMVLLNDPAIAPVPKDQLRGPTPAELETLLQRIRAEIAARERPN